jgi:hypothetical protein
VLAGFRIAAEKAAAGDIKGAVAEYDAIAARGNTSDEVKALARIRAGLILADSATLTEMQSRIGDLAETGNIWRHNAREVLGLAAWRGGDFDSARKYFTQINEDEEAPQDLRQRAQVVLALITARVGAAPEAAKPQG